MGIINYGGAGIPLRLKGQVTDLMALPAGGAYIIPSGPFAVLPGNYSQIQVKEPTTGRWLPFTQIGAQLDYIESDGANFRLFNPTGTAVDSDLTNAGSAYTAIPTVTSNGTGGSLWTAIMGQAISSISLVASVNGVVGGSNYTLPPTVVISPPPGPTVVTTVTNGLSTQTALPGGRPAAAYATISGGSVTAVTIIDAGAGFGGVASLTAMNPLNYPTITFVPHPLDPNLSTIVPAVASVTMSAAGTVTDVACVYNGNPVTSTPTLTFSSGAAAATAVMAYTVTGQTVSGGSGYVAPVAYQTSGGVLTSAQAYPKILPFNIPRQAQGTVTLSGGALSSVSIIDGGLFQTAPSALILQSGTVSIGTIATPTVGSIVDYVALLPL